MKHEQPRARMLGIPFEGTPGSLNAITDVFGVEVGQITLISGEGQLEVGKGPVRTGVTAILPRGKTYEPVFAGWYSLNGNGEMTGTTWIEESGFLETPVMITNTHSVGMVRDAVIAWQQSNHFYDPFAANLWFSLPVVTDAPILPHQLKRIARRVPCGIAKVGGYGGNSSGDIFLAFSTANPGAARRAGIAELKMLPNDQLDPLFEATVQATEEAIINALITASTMTGINGNTVYALPHERLRDALRQYNRLLKN